jgi:hypothetical protein
MKYYIKYLVVRAPAGRSLPAPGSFVNAAYIADGPGYSGAVLLRLIWSAPEQTTGTKTRD